MGVLHWNISKHPERQLIGRGPWDIAFIEIVAICNLLLSSMDESSAFSVVVNMVRNLALLDVKRFLFFSTFERKSSNLRRDTRLVLEALKMVGSKLNGYPRIPSMSPYGWLA